MGRMYVASVLTAISGKQPAKVADVELKPIAPGVWAAWARQSNPKAVVPAEPMGAPAPSTATLRPARSET